MHKFQKLLKRGALCLALATLFLAQTASAADAPQVSSIKAAPYIFNPKNSESTNITFHLNTSSYYTIEILQNPDYNLVKKVVADKLAPGAGDYTEAWDGKLSAGSNAPSGQYTVKITAKNAAGESSNWTSVTVDSPAAQPSETAPTISAISATPKTFNPKAPQSTNITFHLDKAATYSMDVLKSGTVIDTITPGKNAISAGDYTEAWDGQTAAGPVSEGSYLVRVKASNTAGAAPAAYTIVYVDYPTSAGPVCGNNVCEAGESATSCASDCGGGTTGPVCGNGVCESGETSASCAADCGSQGSGAPVISNDYAYPNPFNPTTQKTKIYYTLNVTAQVTVTVLSGTETRSLKSSQSEGPGTYYVEWDGKGNSGGTVSDGSQLYKIIAQNSAGYDVELGTVETKITGSTPGNDLFPKMSNVYVDPFMFDPLVKETKVCYTLNANANVSIAVLDGDTEVRKLINELSRTAGSHCESWNGKSSNGSYANSGTYTVKLYASNSVGYDIELTSVLVNLGQSYTPNEPPKILDVSISPDPFNPAIESEALIRYQIDKPAKVNVTIENLTGTVHKYLANGVEKPQGSNLVKWYGEDKFGNPLPAGEYKVRVEAWNVFGLDIYIRKFLLGTGKTVVVVPGPTICAGFVDVPANSAYCDAIIQMKQMGIFTGYEDGTFRPNQPINRAETVKVILLALNKAILSDDGTSVGFLDIPPFAWFNKYLRTARVHSIIEGYPDGTFRPSATVNRVELLKIFLEATKIPMSDCYGQPYPDVPGNHPWYLKYACFAKQYNLINPDGYGNMHPSTPMTRGDVADLFFRFQSQGLFNVFPH